MIYRKINPFLLGVCIAYASLGICQLTNAHMLSSKLYMTVAIVSSELSIVELLKAITKRLECMSKRRQTLCNEHIVDFEELPSTGDSKKSRYSTEKLNAFFIKAGHITVSLGYAAAVFFMIRTPFKAIPDTEQTSIEIGAITLFTFAFMFLSMIINEAADYEDQELESLIIKCKRDETLLSELKSLSSTIRADTTAEDTNEEK